MPFINTQHNTTQPPIIITNDQITLMNIAASTSYLFSRVTFASSTWPKVILWDADQNNGNSSTVPQKNRKKNHCGKRAGIRHRQRANAHHPRLPSIPLANIQSLINKLDNIRAWLHYQRDMQDCNILCFTETWLTSAVPDHTILPADTFLRQN